MEEDSRCSGCSFDWEDQAKSIVQTEPSLSENEWKRSRVLLLDHDMRSYCSIRQ